MVNFSRRSVSFSRRSFVQKLGLGMGASLLGPLARDLIKEAHGQGADRKIAMFWFAPNGISVFGVFPPPEFAEPSPGPDGNGATKNTSTINSSAFTLPDAFSPFKKGEVAMLDGLKSTPRKGEDAGHGQGYMALTCVPGADINHFIPGNISYDQHLANTIGANTPWKSVLIASSSHIDKDMKDNLFALGPSKTIAAFQNPVLLFKNLFGNAMAQAGGVGTPSVKNRLLFDGLRYDIARLESQFAAPEKDKLTSYLATIENYEKSLAATGSLSCSGGTAPTLTQTGEAVAVLRALNDLGSIALVCGMTNVMGVDIGSSDSHDYGPDMTSILPPELANRQATAATGVGSSSLADVGHMPDDWQNPVIAATYKMMSGMAASTLATLQTTPSVASAFVLMTSDNGAYHHSNHQRWPVLLAGNAGSLKLDGRFIRYPDLAEMSLVDLYRAIGVGLGVPDGSFGTHADGMGANIPTQGPLPELLA